MVQPAPPVNKGKTASALRPAWRRDLVTVCLTKEVKICGKLERKKEGKVTVKRKVDFRFRM